MCFVSTFVPVFSITYWLPFHLNVFCFTKWNSLFNVILDVHLSLSSSTTAFRYVTDLGDDRSDCSTASRPCLTIGRALDTLNVVNNQTSDDASIYLDSLRNNASTKWLCQLEQPLLIRRNVSIVGLSRSFHFGCATHVSSRLLVVNVTGSDVIRLSLTGLNVRGVLFVMWNCQLIMDGVRMGHARWSFPTGNPFFYFSIKHSTWDLSHRQVNLSSDVQISAETLHLRWTDSTFSNIKFSAFAGRSTEVTVDNCTFTNAPDHPSVNGGLNVFVKDRFVESTVWIRDSRFVHQMHEDPVQSVRNLYEAALLVRVSDAEKEVHGVLRVVIRVDRCTFDDNERGLTLIGSFRFTNITDCVFANNLAMHAGAGLLSIGNQGTEITVTRSVFEGNAAGFYRIDKVRRHLDTFRIDRNEVTIESACCKGVVAFVGKGGAIRLHRSNLTVVDCLFRNNTARLLGGSLFVDREATLAIVRSQLENSATDEHSMEGDLLYSNGFVIIESARIRVITATSHVTIVHHSGTHWSFDVASISVECPIGYRLRVTNASAYQVTTLGLQRSFKLDQLSYYCEPCARNKYSLDRGFLNYSRSLDATLIHYTLNVNGQAPTTPALDLYVYRDITCRPCPYGGRCRQQIAAVPNFWGYETNSGIRFQNCPKGYCCTSMDCRGYNRCAPHRTGPLCGRCEDGFSEALFSSDCVPDDLCDSTWLWPVLLGSGVLYFLFLLFQKDIRDLMFLNGLKLENFNCVLSKLRRPVNGHEAPIIGTGHQDIRREIYPQKPKPVAQNGKASYELNELNSCYEETLRSFPLRESFTSDSSTHLPPPPPAAVETAAAGAGADAPASADLGVSFIIISFFYFQDAQLLHVKTVFTSVDNRFKAVFRDFLAGLFKFRIEIFQFFDQYCYLRGITPTMKLLVRVLFVPYVLAQFGIVFLVYKWCTLRGGTSKRPPGGGSSSSNSNTSALSTYFSTRLASGFVLALLFVYQKLATTSFTLLNCVPIENRSVLYIDGTITCYEIWQYWVLAYAVACTVPFCLVLLLGPELLRDCLISLLEFFVACIFPFPFLLRWIVIRLRLRGHRPIVSSGNLSAETQAVVQILQGPFKEIELRLLGPICGQGLLIGRRLILVLLYTFVNDNLIRMLGMILLCFVVLLHHIHALPYKDRRGNMAGSLSASALIMVAAINLVRAGFQAAEYVPHGPNEKLMEVFEELESVLMLWVPAAVMAFALACLVFKLLLLILRRLMTVSKLKSSRRAATSSAALVQTLAVDGTSTRVNL